MLPQRLACFYFFHLVCCALLLSYLLIKFALSYFVKFGLKDDQPDTHEIHVEGVK